MNEIEEIQEALRVIAFQDTTVPLVSVDGIYGFQTQRAVSVFQQQYGLPISGEVDPITWDRLMQIRESLSPRTPTSLQVFIDDDTALAPGDESETVSLIKSMLRTIYADDSTHAPQNRTPIYDRETLALVRQLRKLHDLEENDLIDYDVWEILANLYNTRQRYGREIR